MAVLKAKIGDKERMEMRRVLLHLHAKFPFWASLVRHAQVIATPEVPSAAVAPGDVVLVNPEYYFSERLSTEDRVFILAHEAAHLALRVFDRLEARNRKIWNIAQDLVINELLALDLESRFNRDRKSQERWYPPKDVLRAKDAEEFSSEQLYEMLMHEAEALGMSLEGQRHPSAGRRLCEQHPGMAARLREILLQFSSFVSDIVEESVEGEILHEGERDETPWEFRVRRALTQSRMFGTGARGAELFARRVLQPRVRWQLPLAAAIRRLASREFKLDYTFMHPNHRRMQGSDVVLPSMLGARGRAVFAVDTSGSMLAHMPDGDASYLEQALTELDNARRQFQLEVYLINCDAEVHEGRWIQPYEELPTPKGGGGTSFVPIFRHIEEKGLRPDFVVVLTDGEGSYPETPPPCDVIWVVFGDETPPFGEVIRVEL